MESQAKSVDIQRLLVLSDTHGNICALETVLNWAKAYSQSGGINTAVFLGDGISDIKRVVASTGFLCEWKMVRGNNDFEHSLPLSDVLDFGGHKLFLCHGHRYSIYNGYYPLVESARNLNAEAVLFGHTHVPCHEKDDNILLINPGSVGRPRSRTGATFAVIGCEPGKPLEAEFWGIADKGKVNLLTHIS